MNEIKNFKEQIINNFISSEIDLDDLDSVDVSKIKEGLRSLLQETPGVEFNYESETSILEDGSKGKRNRKLKSISIAYTYEEDNQIRFDRLNYVVG